jgi:hypothetical protein
MYIAGNTIPGEVAPGIDPITINTSPTPYKQQNTRID